MQILAIRHQFVAIFILVLLEVSTLLCVIRLLWVQIISWQYVDQTILRRVLHREEERCAKLRSPMRKFSNFLKILNLVQFSKFILLWRW